MREKQKAKIGMGELREEREGREACHCSCFLGEAGSEADQRVISRPLPGVLWLGKRPVQVAAELPLTRLPVTCQSYFWNVESGSERGREGGSASNRAGKLPAASSGGQPHSLPPPLQSSWLC